MERMRLPQPNSRRLIYKASVLSVLACDPSKAWAMFPGQDAAPKKGPSA